MSDEKACKTLTFIKRPPKHIPLQVQAAPPPFKKNKIKNKIWLSKSDLFTSDCLSGKRSISAKGPFVIQKKALPSLLRTGWLIGLIYG